MAWRLAFPLTILGWNVRRWHTFAAFNDFIHSLYPAHICAKINLLNFSLRDFFFPVEALTSTVTDFWDAMGSKVSHLSGFRIMKISSFFELLIYLWEMKQPLSWGVGTTGNSAVHSSIVTQIIPTSSLRWVLLYGWRSSGWSTGSYDNSPDCKDYKSGGYFWLA